MQFSECYLIVKPHRNFEVLISTLRISTSHDDSQWERKQLQASTNQKTGSKYDLRLEKQKLSVKQRLIVNGVWGHQSFSQKGLRIFYSKGSTL